LSVMFPPDSEITTKQRQRIQKDDNDVKHNALHGETCGVTRQESAEAIRGVDALRVAESWKRPQEV
ncbi:MAG: hypothetical protein KJ950_06750, partial [Proteobacteria bacterium]|nr:hypothetical protein [Pseudomonadota bacterium]